MSNATLMYVVKNNNEIRNLRLENESLYFIDNYTRQFKNEEDFINNYRNKDKIYNFIKENGNNRGKLVISYALSVKDKKNLEPLYNSRDSFVFDEDPYEGKVTDIEKARKLLFNSKNQLFTKLILKRKILDKELNKYIDLTIDENNYIKEFGIKTLFINNKHYISFKSLFEYRIKSQKLGYIRKAYQDMLNILKNRIMQLDKNAFYYYNREIRVVMNEYYDLINEMTICNLSIKKLNSDCKYILIK